ncbi:hypothetical protein LAZ67_12000855 [Cordylochernes scorpioides]|uniref:Uncharacterized protein n=1 Tax=Cordylochernes scorpioides TaxID=51811 RepID=A0ABY6L1P1_9ARAC|nr:hypothetical protein LAZ67_12000855 [Cordylochernes scorpioides]
MLQTAYGDAVMSRRRVFEWYKRFKEGREDTADNERSGRPSTSTTPEKVDKVLELVREDRRITVREVAEEAGISFGSTQSIMKDILGVRRLNAVLVPKDLTFDQKNARKETASLNLEATTDDPELLKRASEWRFKNEPRPKKARKAPSKVKVMLTVFFDYQGIVHREFQQQGSTIIADSYLGVLRRLREAIRKKRPELWRSNSWILHHDNAPAHTTLKISRFLQDHSTSVFPQPPCSPDLAPCDFFLFGKLKKKKLKRRKFQSIEEIKVESKAMKAIPKTDYQRKIWKQFTETGTIKRKEGSGRKRKTATSEDRYLVVTAKRHREMTAIQLSNELSSATGTRISRQTVYRRLHEGALYARRPMVFLAVTHPSTFFSGGTLTAQRYRDETLEPYLRPYRDQIGHNLILMDDNARPHRARLVNEYLQSENIRRMDWPARSPDLNPIEHVWDALGRRIGARHPSPRTLVELRTALLEEWGLLPLDLLQSLVNSMRARCETLIAVRARVPLQGYGGAVSVLMLESAAKASASMLGTASNYRQSQTFTKVCLYHGAMINESCTPILHSMRSDVDLHAASPVAQNKQGRVQDLGRGFCPISIIQSPQTSHFATSKQLSILQCNINGLCSTATKIKLEEIMEIAEKQKIQIIALQETKLNEKYNLKFKNYNILRKDRNKEGGGLAFLIKNLYYEDIAINIPNTSDLEAQGIKVYLNQNKTINIFNMYHPPNNKLIDDGTMAQFLTDNTIIVGDLNAKHQLWGCFTSNPRGKILSNLFDDNAFMCLNDGNPTHHSYSYNTAQALDISFSSPDIFHKCKWQILKSIGSDHLPILIEISTKTKTSSIKEKFWNFKKANWNLYQQNTNEDFRKAPTRIKDLEQNWISFKNTIIKAAKVSIPRGNIKKWIPNYTHQAKDIQILITKRNELQKKCTQNQTNCRTELNIVNAKIKRLYVNMKREKWKQTCENLNPRNPNTKLWHLAKQIDRAQPQTENTNMIKNTDGTPATNDKNAANLLGNSYQISSKIKFEIKDKKVEKKARKIIHDCKNVTSTHNIFHEKINMKELDYALENTDLNKTPGPDGIHGQMISNLGKNGKEKLLDIFNNSWKTGKLPQDWKTATIIPIKKLDKSADDPKNYRPISLRKKFANKHKLEFNPQKSETCLFTTDKKLYKIRPKIILKEQQLQYIKHPKYLGYTLDPEINSSKHIEEVIRKGRDRLKILKYISGREWGADATTLKLTYTSLIRLILEYGYQIYGTASETNLKSLERIQLSAARIITGLRNTCPNDIVLYEADIMPLKDRRSYNLPKYINKIKSYGNKHRTSKYILNWESKLRLKKEGPLHLAKINEFLKYKVEKNYLAEKISPCKPLQNVIFNATLNEPTNKQYQNSEYLKQLSLEIINNIPKNAITTYTDGSRDELGNTGSGCLIKTTNGIEKMNRRNPDFCSVFRSELIAIYEALKSIRNTNYQNIWILTDSRSAIQHLSHTGELRDKHSWYSGVNPGEALKIRNRQHQTTLTRFRTGHLKPLKIENNNKIYPTCPKCSLVPAAPEHILACIRCTKQDLWERPLLIIKQLEEHELMEFVLPHIGGWAILARNRVYCSGGVDGIVGCVCFGDRIPEEGSKIGRAVKINLDTIWAKDSGNCNRGRGIWKIANCSISRGGPPRLRGPPRLIEQFAIFHIPRPLLQFPESFAHMVSKFILTALPILLPSSGILSPKQTHPTIPSTPPEQYTRFLARIAQPPMWGRLAEPRISESPNTNET